MGTRRSAAGQGHPAWGFTKGVCPLRGDRTRGLAPFVGVHEAGFRAEWATGARRTGNPLQSACKGSPAANGRVPVVLLECNG